MLTTRLTKALVRDKGVEVGDGEDGTQVAARLFSLILPRTDTEDCGDFLDKCPSFPIKDSRARLGFKPLYRSEVELLLLEHGIASVENAAHLTDLALDQDFFFDGYSHGMKFLPVKGSNGDLYKPTYFRELNL